MAIDAEIQAEIEATVTRLLPGAIEVSIATQLNTVLIPQVNTAVTSQVANSVPPAVSTTVANSIASAVPTEVNRVMPLYVDDRISGYVPFAVAAAAEDLVATFDDRFAGKADLIHTHAITDVVGLQTALTSKADVTALTPYALSADVATDLATKQDVIVRSFLPIVPTLDVAGQLSTTKDTYVSYYVGIESELVLAAGTIGTITLEYADDVGMTTNLNVIAEAQSGFDGTITVSQTITGYSTAAVSGIIPAGKFRRITTALTAGTPIFTAKPSLEVIL